MHPMMAELGVVMSEWRTEKVIVLQRTGILLLEDGKHGEYKPRPDLSIRMADLRAGKAVSRRYRNRRIGYFLRELDLTEGRSTGISEILKVIKENGSPAPEFDTDNDCSYFLIRLPVHEDAVVVETPVKTPVKTSGKIIELILQNASITIPEMASKIGITERSIERNIRKLQAEGKFKRIGPAKGGHWVVREVS